MSGKQLTLPWQRCVRGRVVGAVAALTLLVGVAPVGQANEHTMEPIEFKSIPGWAADDHSAALYAFRQSCRGSGGQNRSDEQRRLETLCERARMLGQASRDEARRFFESNFLAMRAAGEGFVTGYFEPVLKASLTRTKSFRYPLYQKPQGLNPLPDRSAIMDGALADRGLEVLWLDNPIDGFFVAIQGSARVETPEGKRYRLRYAGKSGHPYTPVGRVLIERGEIPRDQMSMQAIKDWMYAHPDAAEDVMRLNQSYIFFSIEEDKQGTEGPVGAAGVPLIAGRSLALDHRLYSYGLPVFIGARLPDGQGAVKPFNRLMVAHDTGSAIRGPARGDIFFGSGYKAGEQAGRIRHSADFVVLRPRP